MPRTILKGLNSRKLKRLAGLDPDEDQCPPLHELYEEHRACPRPGCPCTFTAEHIEGMVDYFAFAKQKRRDRLLHEIEQLEEQETLARARTRDAREKLEAFDAREDN